MRVIDPCAASAAASTDEDPFAEPAHRKTSAVSLADKSQPHREQRSSQPMVFAAPTGRGAAIAIAYTSW
jgi:hypothetical protein